MYNLPINEARYFQYDVVRLFLGLLYVVDDGVVLFLRISVPF